MARRNDDASGCATIFGVVLVIGIAIYIIKWALITAAIMVVPYGTWYLWDRAQQQQEARSVQPPPGPRVAPPETRRTATPVVRVAISSPDTSGSRPVASSERRGPEVTRELLTEQAKVDTDPLRDCPANSPVVEPLDNPEPEAGAAVEVATGQQEIASEPQDAVSTPVIEVSTPRALPPEPKPRRSNGYRRNRTRVADPYSKSGHDGGPPDHLGPCKPWHYCAWCPCPDDHPDRPHQGAEHREIVRDARQAAD